MSYDFRTIVARDCVGDRSLQAHDANLFDMEQKYADLMDSAAIIAASRIYVKIHHASDVIGGVVVGVALGKLAKRIFPLHRSR